MPPDPASPSSTRFVRAGVIASVVIVFAVTIAAVTVWLRREMHAQIQQREAASIAATVAMQLDANIRELPATTPVSEVPGMLLVMALDTMQRLRVAGDTAGSAEREQNTGLRVFDAEAKPNGAYPFEWSEQPPPAGIWAQLQHGESVGHLRPETSVEEILDLPRNLSSAPAFEAWVPLQRSEPTVFLGAVQFVMNGSPVAAQIHRHDRRLVTQAVIAWAGGSIAIVFALSWAFRRLDAANRELRARTEDLERANRELVLAAKTSALGAVTAHLIHELKNPIAGLEVIVGGQAGSGEAGAPGGELAAASELTRRLRGMVNDVVGVLRDEQTGAKFELSGIEIAEAAVGKVRPDAERNGVKLQLVATGDVSFPARRANLATLVLRNLLQNAVEASTTGGSVKVTTRENGDGAEFLVEDYGRGLPAAVRARMFQPCASTKVGGSGLGLALSHQLAQRAGGRLDVVRSDEFGTCFRLVLPAEA